MNVNESKPLNIKNWSPEDRPREKLLLKGTAALSDAELVAILLGTGTATQSAVDLAKQVLKKADNNLFQLAKFSVRELMKTKGIGEAKAISIVAALELGRRRKETEPEDKPKLTTSAETFEFFRPNFQDLPHEEFWVALLNRSNKVIRKKLVSIGGVAGTVADPKIIFKLALEELASAIIVAHNHPSGSIQPSSADRELTKRLKEAGKLLDVQMLDHIIIANNQYYSFADEGLI